uniref:unspecific monooxygenase n=1 Tax=Spodoptera frugiperda TaxID=7108 RepID=S4VGG6_SPOFR|nr:cytochrome P450 CYP321A10 [Spodoptera frugiperda]
MVLLPITLALITLVLVWYFIGIYNENYWRKRGVVFYSKNKVLGPLWDFLVSPRPLFQVFGDLYQQYRHEPVIGLGHLLTPAMFVINQKNVQQVLSGDFQSFNHRGMESIEGDQLSDNITFMTGPRWKLMRSNMTPLFTANKLKNMYYIMDKSAQDFVQYLKNNPKTRDGNLFETFMMFCNAAVCGAIFGIGSESIFDSPFLKVARGISQSNLSMKLKFVSFIVSPKLSSLLGLKFFKDYEEFFVKSIGEVLKRRDQENVKRHDFADIALAIQKNGTMRDRTTGYEIEPTTGILSAQALFFFAAGVEPCANAIYATLYLLSVHPEILEDVHQEIDKHFEKYNNNITYDVICEMEYTEKVLSEAMRMFPPIGFLTRQCVQDTVLPVGNIPVQKGTKIFTPIYDIHHDPELYPDPEVFDPERFSKDRRPNDDIYMPFGMGNRTCIGARYAKLQVQAGLVHVLRNFTVASKQTDEKVTFKHDSFNVRLKNVDVQLIPRNVK